MCVGGTVPALVNGGRVQYSSTAITFYLNLSNCPTVTSKLGRSSLVNDGPAAKDGDDK